MATNVGQSFDSTRLPSHHPKSSSFCLGKIWKFLYGSENLEKDRLKEQIAFVWRWNTSKWKENHRWFNLMSWGVLWIGTSFQNDRKARKIFKLKFIFFLFSFFWGGILAEREASYGGRIPLKIHQYNQYIFHYFLFYKMRSWDPSNSIIIMCRILS